MFESNLSSLQSWISDAMQTTDTVTRSLQSLPFNAEELVNVTTVLSVRSLCIVKTFTY